MIEQISVLIYAFQIPYGVAMRHFYLSVNVNMSHNSIVIYLFLYLASMHAAYSILFVCLFFVFFLLPMFEIECFNQTNTLFSHFRHRILYHRMRTNGRLFLIRFDEFSFCLLKFLFWWFFRNVFFFVQFNLSQQIFLIITLFSLIRCEFF